MRSGAALRAELKWRTVKIARSAGRRNPYQIRANLDLFQVIFGGFTRAQARANLLMFLHFQSREGRLSGVRDVGVAGSNPVTPTNNSRLTPRIRVPWIASANWGLTTDSTHLFPCQIVTHGLQSVSGAGPARQASVEAFRQTVEAFFPKLACGMGGITGESLKALGIPTVLWNRCDGAGNGTHQY